MTVLIVVLGVLFVAAVVLLAVGHVQETNEKKDHFRDN